MKIDNPYVEDVRLDERVTFLREAGMVERCHVFPTARRPTVGVHTFNAVNLYLLLCPEPQVDTIKEIMWHDAGERGVGDMPSTAKWASPDLAKYYEDAERKIRIRYGLESNFNLSELPWVVGVDKLEFFLFCQEEMLLGNSYAVSRLRNIRNSLDDHVNRKNLPPEVLQYYMQVRNNARRMICDVEVSR